MNGARLYGRYVAASLRAQMQYPGSFIATSIGAFAATVIDFIGLWALFARFRQIEAWRFEEVALFYAVVSVSFAIADAITRGFDVFGERFVKTATSTASSSARARPFCSYSATSSAPHASAGSRRECSRGEWP